MKKILLSLFVGFVGIISFCSALDFQYSAYDSVSIAKSSSYTSGFKISANSIVCFRTSSSYNTCSWNNLSQNITYNDVFCVFNTGSSVVNLNISCTNTNAYNPLTLYWNKYNLVNSACPSCPTCPSCQTCTGYSFSVFDNGSRIVNSPINTDINLFMQGSLFFTDLVSPDGDYVIESSCSTGNDCIGSGDYTGDLQRSNIYINNILHPGRQFVNIEIPDYITWDYSVGDDDFNLYVGSGYDVDYIESVIDINSYRPTSEDFTNVFVSGLTLVMPYIVIALFIIFVRKLLKRIFK